MASTASGWQYAVPNDTLVAWPAVSQAVADKLEISLPKSAGLQLVKSQAIGSGVSQVIVSNAFNSTYDAYKIVVGNGAGSTVTSLTAQLGNGGTFSTSSYGTFLWYIGFGASTGVSSTANAGGFDNSGYVTSQYIDASYDVINPFLAKETILKNGSWNYPGGTGFFTGRHQVGLSYADFKLIPTSGTLTGGTIYVYGYAKV
jgi:hypothetical protein